MMNTSPVLPELHPEIIELIRYEGTLNSHANTGNTCDAELMNESAVFRNRLFGNVSRFEAFASLLRLQYDALVGLREAVEMELGTSSEGTP